MNPGWPAPSFVNDLETCVGCHACVVACANENQLAPGTSWRQVVTFNDARWPGLPVFHLSLACNHCRDAPCLLQCPARAISRDSRTQAVVIDEGACIGCRYCSWVCPYDAPRFDAGRGVMGKCTWCADRLAAGLDPACVGLCPVGALRLDEHRDDEPRAVAGFPERGIRPLIRFEPIRRRASAAPVLLSPPTVEPMPTSSPPAPKISLRSEWTLALFTFVAIALVAVWTGAWLRSGEVPRGAFFLAGVGAAAMSILHLGRPARAWRAAVNWRASWLSREILCFTAFLAASAWSAVLAPQNALAAGLAVAIGLACLVCVDRVYSVMARTTRTRVDGVEAVSSGAFLAGVFAGSPLLFVPLGAVRIATLATRVHAAKRSNAHGRHASPVSAAAGPRGVQGHFVTARAAVGWLLPLAIWLGGWPWAGPFALALVLAGEAMDRAVFYDAIEIVTPRLQMTRDLACRAGPSLARREV